MFRHVPRNEQLIPTAQVAELLGVDVRTVHRMTTNGLLPSAYKIPGRTGAYLFDPVVVEMYRRQKTSTAA